MDRFSSEDNYVRLKYEYLSTTVTEDLQPRLLQLAYAGDLKMKGSLFYCIVVPYHFDGSAGLQNR